MEVAAGSLAAVTFVHCSSISSFPGLLQELGGGPLLNVEIALDVTMLQHEVLADLDLRQVLRRQAGHHVDVLDALVGVLDVAVVGLAVQDHGRGVLVFVGPAPHLDHRLQEGDDQFGVLLGHHVAAGDDCGLVVGLQPPVRVTRQVLDCRDLPRVLLQVLPGLAVGVDRIDLAFQQRRLQRAGDQGMLVVHLPHVELGRAVRRPEHLRVGVPVVGMRELDDLDILEAHVVEHQHVQD
ncbi:MAG: hypothetical protein WCA12_02205, partial [Burkholderiales bacterium]